MTPQESRFTSRKLGTIEIIRGAFGMLRGKYYALFQAVVVPASALGAAETVHAKIPFHHSILIELAIAILGISFEVSWRRYLVRNEKLTVFYFGNAFWSFLGRTYLAYFIMFLAWSVIFIILIATGMLYYGSDFKAAHNSFSAIEAWDKIIIFAFAAISALPPIWWLIRHVLYFTAKAVSDKALTLRDSSALMKGNVISFAVAFVIVTAPILLTAYFISIALHGKFGDLPPYCIAILSITSVYSLFINVAVIGAVCSWTYKCLVPSENIPDNPLPPPVT